jgi:hypothetical protein
MKERNIKLSELDWSCSLSWNRNSHTVSLILTHRIICQTYCHGNSGKPLLEVNNEWAAIFLKYAVFTTMDVI